MAAAGLAGCPGGSDDGDGGSDGEDGKSNTDVATSTPTEDGTATPVTTPTPTEDGTAEPVTTPTPTEDGAAATVAPADPGIAEQIREHRTADLTVEVTDADGNAVEGADVSVAMQEHEFTFGTAINAGTLINQSSEGDSYREVIPELFNTAVMENQMKWGFWERDQGLADEAVQWCHDQGLDVRGHVCIWGREDSGAIPPDIQSVIEEGDAETIRERSMQHVEDIITHYGEDITEWEVVNEAMHVFQLQLGVYGDRINREQPWAGEVVPWTSDLLAEWYSHARSVIEDEGLDVGLAVNDFNQFAYRYTDERYQTEIDHINENGAQLDTVGLQGHVGARTGEFNTNASPDGRISASQVVSEIDRFADHGANVKITEFDTYGGDDWEGDEERADALRNYLRGAFAHPGVDGFLVWGFWDGRHWNDEAPLFYDDWEKKPGYDVWAGLVFDEWWTEAGGTTDGDGSFSTAGFKGEYEVTATIDGEEVIGTVALSEGGATVELSP